MSVVPYTDEIGREEFLEDVRGLTEDIRLLPDIQADIRAMLDEQRVLLPQIGYKAKLVEALVLFQKPSFLDRMLVFQSDCDSLYYERRRRR